MIFVAAASMVEGSRVCTRGVGQNPTRTGAVDFMRSMGERSTSKCTRSFSGRPKGPRALRLRHFARSPWRANLWPAPLQDLAVLVALAARASGTTEI